MKILVVLMMMMFMCTLDFLLMDIVLCVCVQGQACVLVLRAMQSRDVQQLLGGAPWTELCVKVAGRLAAVGQHGSTSQSHNTRYAESQVSCSGNFTEITP